MTEPYADPEWIIRMRDGVEPAPDAQAPGWLLRELADARLRALVFALGTNRPKPTTPPPEDELLLAYLLGELLPKEVVDLEARLRGDPRALASLLALRQALEGKDGDEPGVADALYVDMLREVNVEVGKLRRVALGRLTAHVPTSLGAVSFTLIATDRPPAASTFQPVPPFSRRGSDSDNLGPAMAEPTIPPGSTEGLMPSVSTAIALSSEGRRAPPLDTAVLILALWGFWGWFIAVGRCWADAGRRSGWLRGRSGEGERLHEFIPA